MQVFGQEADVYEPHMVGMPGHGLGRGEGTCGNQKPLTLFISDCVSLYAFIGRKSWNVKSRKLLNNFWGKSKGFRSWQTRIQISVQAFWTVDKTLFFFSCKGSEILKNLPKVIELVCNHFSNLWLLNKPLQNLVT